MNRVIYSVDVVIRDGSIILRISGSKIEPVRDGGYDVIEMMLTPSDAEILARRLFRATRMVIPADSREIIRRIASIEAKSSTFEKSIETLASKMSELGTEIDQLKKLIEDIKKAIQQ
jgi:septal ring factor EnvC (AmiA/AmiB activator)